MLLQSKWVYLNPINQGVSVPSEIHNSPAGQVGQEKAEGTSTFVTYAGISPDALGHENPTLCSSHAFLKGKKENLS